MLKSMLAAFSMYSKIPVPQIEWKEENHKYSLCFFPLIGVVIDIFLYIWSILAFYLQFHYFTFAAAFTVIPVLVTGGIHLDGFCDVLDAKYSYADKEKKLEIMKDSRIGAFAAIGLAVYFISQFGLYASIQSEKGSLSVLVIFIMSRALSGIGAVTLKCAKKKGTLQSFTKPADKKITMAVLISIFTLCALFLMYIDFICGICTTAAALICFIYYRHFSYKNFGGITGDLEGYFLQICEIVMLAVIVSFDSWNNICC